MQTTNPRVLWLVLATIGCGGEAAIAPSEPPAPVVAPDIDHTVLRAPARPFGDPVAVVDLMNVAAADSVSVAWHFVDASIIEIDSNDPGPDLRPTGPAVRSHDVSPRPRTPGWDDAAWTPVDPPSLSVRRGHGHFALGWFRTSITLPARIGETDTRGTTVVFEIVADDYSEVWVDGRLSASPGDAGGGPVSGFNAPNRVVLTRSAEPGHTYDIAVLAMNAPLSVSPPNFLWVRSAVLDVYRPATTDRTEVERIATGFSALAGMVWTGSALLFCDARANTIHRYDPREERIGVWRSHSGYAGADIGRYSEPGASALAVDANERVLITELGNRRLVRIERTAATTVLADRFEDAPLEGLRDVVLDAHETVWTAGSRGVLRVAADGTVALVSHELIAPTALAISADGGALFVADGAPDHAVVLRHPILPDGSLGPSTVALDLRSTTREEALRDLLLDARGNLYVAGASGVTIASEGRVLRAIPVDEPVLGLAWGEDAGTLFIAGRTSLYRATVAEPR